MKMASLGVIMEATKVLGEVTETPTDGSGYIPKDTKDNRVIVSDLPKDDNGSAPAASTVLESNYEGIRGLDVNLMDKETGDGNVSYLSNGGNSSDGEGGQGRSNGEKLEKGGFKVGDFVWGKIKSHPWWPGQVYDPRDASEFAVKHSQEGRLLVAFFGDGSCSWCLPSQLVPFIDNFRQMSIDGSSKNFVNAIQRAVDEVGRLVETKIMCKCVPMERRDHLARPPVANAGVREGVLVPEVDVNRLPIPEYEPVEILLNVKNYAKAVSVENMFELGILKSWLSAFYYTKYGYPLAVFKEPFHIEGLEGNDEDGAPVTNDYSVAIKVPVQGPFEEDWISSHTFDSAMSQGLDDKIYYKRKQKSVAELMENDHKNIRKSQKRATSKEGKRDGKMMRKTRVDDFESDDNAEQKLEKIEIADAQDPSYESKDEMESISSPRERKKSKYLSPPYTNLSWRIVDSGTKLESDSKKTIKASLPVPELDDDNSDDQVLNSQSKMTFSVCDVDVPVNELLSEVEFAALDPLYLKKKGSLNMIWGFLSAFRSSTYLHGSEYKAPHKSKRVGRKRKSLPSLMRKQENEDEGKQAEPEPRPTDDLVSDVRVIRQKLDVVTAVLEKESRNFSTEERSFLKDEMKCLMNNVETVTEKVREMVENASS